MVDDEKSAPEPPKPLRKPREGWAESVLAAGPDPEDWSGWDNMENDWDKTGWTWPDNHYWPDESDDTTPISSPFIP